MSEKIGDPLVGLTKHVDFEARAASIDAAAPRPSRAKGGRPPHSTLLMVKLLLLQQLYNLADYALEYQLLDRRSFLQFLDLTESSSIPDAKTIWLFSDRLAQACAGGIVFEQVQQQLHKHGYMARCGQIIDASLFEAPVQRNKREEADTTVFKSLLDRTNTSHAVFGDRGYPINEREATLRQSGWRVNIQLKSSATKGISEAQKKRNRRISTLHARFEHVFGPLAQIGGKLVLHRHRPHHLRFAAQGASYNLKRLVFLKEGGLAPF